MANFTVNTHHAYLNNDIVIKADGQVKIKNTTTGDLYEFDNEMRIHLSAGLHILISDDHQEDIFIEDAIKLGGSKIKNAFVFDNSPWCFVTTKDRLYITNIETNEEKVEYNITPDEIISLPSYVYKKHNEYFLFKTEQDYAIFNVLTGKIVFQFTNHIFSNGHLVIFKKENEVEVYDFRHGKTIVKFDGQYSFGRNKFFFVKEKQLYGLNLNTSYINKISFVGDVQESDMLLGNNLLRQNNDYLKKKIYSYFSLGNGEVQDTMSETKIVSPYYIECWEGEVTPYFSQVKEDYMKFNEELRKTRLSYPNIHTVCFGVKITGTSGHWKNEQYVIKLHGEMFTYPDMGLTIPFIVEGGLGETINISDYTINVQKEQEIEKTSDKPNISFALEVGEREIGVSKSGNLMVTYDGEFICMRDAKKDSRQRILVDSFDTSNYANAYFTSDGKNVLLRISNKEAQLIGLDTFFVEPYNVESFNIARNEGYNGYKPEVSLDDTKKTVWRDPITLDIISAKDMSNHVFKSPDGKYIANTKMKTIIYNRLTRSEISIQDAIKLRSYYNWSVETGEEEKKAIIERREKLATESDRGDLFGKIIDMCNKMFSHIEDEKKKEKVCNEAIEECIERYINKECDFASLIIDKLGYVCYHKNDDEEEKQILIGRSVFYLNYVSFSYDSKYLSFAAKMRGDEFRFSEEGVFAIYDLENEEFINRIEKNGNSQLWAVWMSMFSQKGDVAFYDSHANAYLARKSNKYTIVEKAAGKSLLCFSPSGRYIACSDQNYIDYTHHPFANWGHQPSGNVFIHSVDKFGECLEQYNDMGDGISGVAYRAGDVSSAAFSQDETKLLMVGNDGVVVVRNLKITQRCKDHNYDDGYDDEDKDYGTHYGEYAGTYAQDVAGYSDAVIDDVFEGDPDAYWNID